MYTLQAHMNKYACSLVTYDRYWSLDLSGLRFCTCGKQVIIWVGDPSVP